jgi:Barrel-sandwich domain of CusB or HlyD membrane-fusion
MAATETSIEAARNRIQRLIEEIAALCKADLPSEEFFPKFLDRVVAASDAKGGAVWLVGSRAQDNKSEFQLCAQVEFASSLFQSDEAQRTTILKLLTDVVKTKRPGVLGAPQSVAPEAQAASANKTPYPFLHVPLFLKEQPIGVLQVWLQPYVTPQNYGEFVTFLSSLSGYVEQHLQSRQLGNLVLETQRLQQLLRFTNDLAGSLDVLEVARLTANYGRDLAGCERASVLLREGDRWRVLAISGQETVEKKSALVKAMVAFVAAHSADETQILSKKELLARAESRDVNNNARDISPQSDVPNESANGAPQESSRALALRNTDEVDFAYFQLSHVVSAVICPMLDTDKRLVGALFCESTFEGYFDGGSGKSELLPARRIAEWLTSYSSRALRGARSFETLPFLPVTKRIRDAKLLLTSEKRNRTLLRLGIIAFILLVIALWPARVKVDGDCLLQPLNRAAVAPETAGRIEKVFVREGDHVAKDQPIAQLDTRRLKLEMDTTDQEKLRYMADADRLRAVGDEAAAQVSFMQVKVLGEQQKRIQAEIDSATLRSPIDGMVMTKDLELRAGDVLQQGAPFAEIAGTDAWDLHAEINEKDIGTVEKALNEKGSVNLSYILYSQSSHVLRGQLNSRQQISAAAYPKEKENVFIVTIHNPPIPPELSKSLRPGLTGRAKLELGRRPFIFNIARKIYRWFQYRMIG